VTCYTQPCKLCKVTCILHYLPQGDESSPRGGWGICAPALPEVLTEIPADRQQLKDLIRHEARAMAKKIIDSALEEKLKAMKMTVSKNAGRGQQRPGASTKIN
jgi:hypothetical protein